MGGFGTARFGAWHTHTHAYYLIVLTESYVASSIIHESSNIEIDLD